jgi:hypothetical protein
MCCSLWLHVLEYFSTVLPNSTYEAGIKVMCCSFVLHVLEYFQQSYPIPTYEQGWGDVLLFVITWSVFNSPTIPTYGIEVMLLFCDCVNSQPNSSTYKAGIEVMCCSFVITCVKVFFQQSYPIPTPIRDWVMCAALCDYVLEYFQQSYPIPTYKAGIKVMCCSFVITC